MSEDIFDFIKARIDEEPIEGSSYQHTVSILNTLSSVLWDHVPDMLAYDRLIEDHPPVPGPFTREFSKVNQRWVYGEPACAQCTYSIQEWRITGEDGTNDRVVAPCDTVRHIASIWQSHKDYKDEYKV